MKFCPICGSQYPNGERCPSCNVMLMGDSSEPANTKSKGRRSRKPVEPEYPDMTYEQPAKADPYAQDPYQQPAKADPYAQDSYEQPAKKEAPAPQQSEADLYGFAPVTDSGSARSDRGRDTGRDRREREPRERREREPRDRREREPRERRERPQREARPARSSGGRGGEIDKRIIIIAGIVIAAVVVVLVLVLFVIPNSKQKKLEAENPFQEEMGEEVTGDVIAEEPAEAEMEEPEITAYVTDFNWSDVDIDATVNSDAEIYGYFRQSDGSDDSDYILSMDDTYNIAFRWDGQDVMMENVAEVPVYNYSEAATDDYTGHMCTLTGNIYMDGSQVYFEMTDIASDELSTMGAVGVHEYSVMQEDVSWEEAFNKAIERGGHLATIESAEEYEHIVAMLNETGLTKCHVYLGGRRDDGGTEYYWVDTNNRFMGDCLNTTPDWSDGYWWRDEPSYVDIGSDAQGEIQENRIGLFCVDGTWYLNDMSNDLIHYYPGFFESKVVYVVEFE